MDMSQFLDTFLAESTEHLQRLNANLLDLEKRPDNLEVLNEILRSAHTLKGMSATMGFKHMAELTHEMESTLILLKDCQVSVTSEVVDVLFRCLDALQGMVNGIESGHEGDFGCLPLKEALQRLQKADGQIPGPLQLKDQPALSKKDDCQFNGYDLGIIKKALDQGYRGYIARIALAPHTVMKAPRVYMVFKAIEDHAAEIIKSEPPVQDLEDENFEDRFDVVFVTREPLEVFAEALGRISEVSVLTLEQIDPVQAQHKTGRSDQSGTNRNGYGGKTSLSLRTVRVGTERLDSLLNLVGELVINKTRLEQLGFSMQNPELQEAVEHMGRLTSDLQSIVMKIRMVPIEQVFNRFPRMVRDLSHDLNKCIQFHIEGEETELDRTVIDEIAEPLVHLIRNAVDHGVEPPEERLLAGKPENALLSLTARQDGNSVIIEVIDDGRGIDLEKVRVKAVESGLIEPGAASDESALLNCLFEPGFSTVEQVTDLSGRGVGMDVAKAKVESLNGSIELETRAGQGTKVTIRLPLTLAIIRAMLVRIADEQYAIPLGAIDEIALVTPDRIKNVQKREAMLLRNRVLPLVRLSDLLQLNSTEEDGEECFVVVVRKGERQYGLVVDALVGLQDVVIKSLGRALKGIPGIAGATILGDGKVSLILAVDSLF